jgi:hypothetical protein
MWSSDPIQGAFPWSTPYGYSFNNPIVMNDPTGLAPPDWLGKLFGRKHQKLTGASFSLNLPSFKDITRGIGSAFRSIGDAFEGHSYHLNLSPSGNYKPTNSGSITIADHNTYMKPSNWLSSIPMSVDVNWKENSEIEFNTSRIEAMGKVGSHVKSINSFTLQYQFFVQNDAINVYKNGLLNRDVAGDGDVLDKNDYTIDRTGILTHTSALRQPTAYTIQVMRNTVKPFSEWNYTVMFNVNAWTPYTSKFGANPRPSWHSYFYGNSGTK